MSKRRRKVLPKEPVRCEIETLSHDGRGGIARADGKTQFVDGALPGETVMAKMVSTRSRFDELRTTEVLEAAPPDRQQPPCEFADLCGGCSLQHMSADARYGSRKIPCASILPTLGGALNRSSGWLRCVLRIASAIVARRGWAYVM